MFDLLGVGSLDHLPVRRPRSIEWTWLRLREHFPAELSDCVISANSDGQADLSGKSCSALIVGLYATLISDRRTKCRTIALSSQGQPLC